MRSGLADRAPARRTDHPARTHPRPNRGPTNRSPPSDATPTSTTGPSSATPNFDGQPWGWRVEGTPHLAQPSPCSATKIISATPLFLGANPAEVRDGPQQGLRILDQRADLAFNLMQSLDPDQRERAVIYDDAPLGHPHLQQLPRRPARLPGGLPAADLDSDQQAVLQRLAHPLHRPTPRRRRRAAPANASPTAPGPISTGPGPDPTRRGNPTTIGSTAATFSSNTTTDRTAPTTSTPSGATSKNDFAADILRDNQLLFTVL